MQFEIWDSLQIVLPFVPGLFLLGWFENAGCKKNKYLLIHLLMAASVSLAALHVGRMAVFPL